MTAGDRGRSDVRDGPTPANIFNIGFGFWASRALLSAVELGVFTELAKGPADLATLSRRLGLHNRSARDFLDALVALKLLDRHDGRYYNTAETDLFLDRGKPSYVGGLLEMANSRLYPNWGLLTEALKTGRNQNEAKELGDVFAALYADPDRLRGFLAAMSGSSLAQLRPSPPNSRGKTIRHSLISEPRKACCRQPSPACIRIFPAPVSTCPR